MANISLGTRSNRDTSLDPKHDFLSDDDDDDNDDDDNDDSAMSMDISEPAPDEATIALEVISECIKSLFRIGILVRKSAPRDRFKRALQMPGISFPAFYDIDYVKQKYPKASLDWLSKRLGGAIAKRRQLIKYCRDHKTRLGVGEENTADEGLATATERLSSKATTFATNAFRQLDAEEEADDGVSAWSTSTTTESLSPLKLPRLADLSPRLEPFECPICFTLQRFKHEKSWQAHAFGDLKAYVYTVGDAACDDEFFGSRDSWFEHELKHHRARYSCVLCSLGPIPAAELRKHVSETHGTFSADQLGMLLDAGQEAIANLKAGDCPFCDDWAAALEARAGSKDGPIVGPKQVVHVKAGRFKKHVAAHQEQLAIFALPRAVEEEGTPGSRSVGASISQRTSLSSLPGNDVGQAEEQDETASNATSQSRSPMSQPHDDHLHQELREVAAFSISDHGSVPRLPPDDMEMQGQMSGPLPPSVNVEIAPTSVRNTIEAETLDIHSLSPLQGSSSYPLLRRNLCGDIAG